MQEIYPYPDNADPLSIFGKKKIMALTDLMLMTDQKNWQGWTDGVYLQHRK